MELILILFEKEKKFTNPCVFPLMQITSKTLFHTLSIKSVKRVYLYIYQAYLSVQFFNYSQQILGLDHRKPKILVYFLKNWYNTK